jgi:hypothetical protein
MFDYDSDEWKEEREEVLEYWDGCCEHCGLETDTPHVHHKYGTSVREYEVLCPECHAEHHGDPDIANYGKKGKPCKYCNRPIQWKSIDGRWVPIDINTGIRHKCHR